MKGKEHMMIGTTATATMGIGFLMNNNIGDVVHLVPLIAGGFIGSYMPDIDSHKSKASQVFNKIIMILMVALVVGYSFGLALSVDDILNIFKYTSENYLVLVFLIGNKYLALGFTTGYILHIVCDRFSPRGKNLKFFEFKLPCRNSKNKTSVDW